MPVKRVLWLVALVALGNWTPRAAADLYHSRFELDRVNRRLRGHVVDYTHNHGKDNRIWSPSLRALRDMYVYLPPGYDSHQRYPFMIWLHGFAQDEQSFLNQIAEPLDHAIVCGQLPPVIVAAPDGSLTGGPCLMTAGSFYLNTKAGNFEDFIMTDVWNFMMESYPLRPEREAHVLAGVSMGGGAAYHLGMKFRDRVYVVLGVLPPLNSRWIDCHGRYMGNFDPCCWGWRTDYSRGREVVGRFYGVIAIRMRNVIGGLYDPGPMTAAEVSLVNPIEMLERLNIQDGELAFYIAYGGRDQFNIDAQVESFLYVAKQRGIHVDVDYDPKGRHDTRTAFRFFPHTIAWLAARIAPYSPPLATHP